MIDDTPVNFDALAIVSHVQAAEPLLVAGSRIDLLDLILDQLIRSYSLEDLSRSAICVTEIHS